MGARLLTDMADAAISPGFDFNADWAVAVSTPTDAVDATVYAVDVTSGQTTAMLDGIGIDAAVSTPKVARSGPGALIVIDSFTEYAVHFLDFTQMADRVVDLTKGGSGVIAPDASASPPSTISTPAARPPSSTMPPAIKASPSPPAPSPGSDRFPLAHLNCLYQSDP